ncbi:hypothetical protein [Bacillus oleivorans]|nr:hypothetical protein [Bacillus oleivorans]
MFKKIQFSLQPKMIPIPQTIKKDCGCSKKKLMRQRPPLKKW